MSQKGQVVLILILVMSVALSIGLSIVQKSLVDISTASKVEQSSRAFSAAEAGIEKALRGDFSTQLFAENNSSIAAITGDSQLAPPVQSGTTRQSPLEYPSLAKEDVAQVWLANFSSPANPPPISYTQQSLDVYWGNSSQDQAALELTLVYHDSFREQLNGIAYQSQKWYLDQSSAVRDPANGFTTVACGGGVDERLGGIQYQCKRTLSDLPQTRVFNRLILIRARLLYNSSSQPFAVQAVGTCGAPCSLPAQSRSITSTGESGETRRRIRVFQESKVVPSYYDYVIFSSGSINKLDQ